MKRVFSIVLCFCLLACLLPLGAQAVDNSRNYDFALTADGAQTVTVVPGQEIRLTLWLNRTDSDEETLMYAAQAELLYDDSFFQLVEGSVTTYDAVAWTDMSRRTGGRAFYLNFLSLSGGEKWKSRVQMGSFVLRVVAESGVSIIKSENSIVSTEDGMDTFATTSNDVQVVISTACTVTFESGGGSPVTSQTVQYGELVTEPEEPERPGYTFNGWYADLDRTTLWDFARDKVQGNMTLYAGWLTEVSPTEQPEENNEFPWWILLAGALVAAVLLLWLLCFGKKKVSFDSRGGTPLEPVCVRYGKCVEAPMSPVKPGAVFAGWYTDPELGRRWVFEQNPVRRNMTLYARWK